MSTELIKLKATADILGGDVFFANEHGADPENPTNDGLLANGMYIRLNGSDGSVAYISAYELDKSIEIINQMTVDKANKADVDTLQSLLEGKASDIDLQLLQAQVDLKASQTDVDDLFDRVNRKVDQSTIDDIVLQLNAKANADTVTALSEQVSTKAEQADLTALTTTVGTKANQAAVTAMEADIAALQETVQLLTNTDSIAAINAQITYLNNEINKLKLDSDLTDTTNAVNAVVSANNALTERVDSLEVNLAKKATTVYVQGQVNEINANLTNINKRIDTKAEKTDVIIKANKSDLDTVVNRINAMGVSIDSMSTLVDTKVNEFTEELAGKASKSLVDTKVNEFTEELARKTDRSLFNTTITRIDNKLNDIEETHTASFNRLSGDIDTVECEVNNTISELRSSLNAQTKQLTSQNTEINKLKTNSDAYSEKLKQNWVRVLTSNEYKKLRTAPEGVPYNDRYKYPNVVYLVVDFNKPKAIYIGDILVAQAEQKGSIGFAYTFPIVF